MKWYRYFFLLGIIFISLGFILNNKINISINTQPQLNFQQKLDYSLKANKLDSNKDLKCHEYLEFCYLTIKSQNYSTLALINTQNDPFFQIASLQKILKMATMNDKQVEFIDLSSKRPYATLKNN